jgi:hypothetical protein
MDKDEAQPMYVCRKCGTHLALQVRISVLVLSTSRGRRAGRIAEFDPDSDLDSL